MKLFDIYIHKKDKSLIQIDSFATHINGDNTIVVYRNIYDTGLKGWSPSFNGYGTAKEIEKDYELLIKADELDKFNDWDEIFDFAETKNKQS